MAGPGGRLSTALVRALAGIVGSGHVLVDPDLRSGYETDWTRRFRGDALAVVRPAHTGEVAACVRACAGARVPVVPQGGNTGLVGGGVPRGGEVVLSLRRLSEIGTIDVDAAQVPVGAGATLAAVQAAARAVGLDVGVDLGARDSATIGGMIATNAGGMQVFRHGAMRRRVVGIEAVLADGCVVRRMSGLLKDNVGYDLPGLLVGSEGTLGVVTAARLALVPFHSRRAVALVACAGFADALALARGLERDLPSLHAVEFLDDVGLGLVCRRTGLAPPLSGAALVLLVECADREPVGDRLAAALDTHAGEREIVFGGDPATARTLWRYREELTEALNAETVPIKLDVTVPLGSLDAFATAAGAAVAAILPSARTVLFGHLLDGNVHVNVNDPARDPVRDEDLTRRIEVAVLEAVAALGGSVSAEHGIGVAKAPFLHLSRGPGDIDAMRAVKHALDPDALLNPGVIFGP